MSDLKYFKSSDLNWNFNFYPRRLWPRVLPVLIKKINEEFFVLAGFDRLDNAEIGCLEIYEDVDFILNEIYPRDSLAPLETLRLARVVNKDMKMREDFLSLPIPLQHLFDARQVPLKSLKPILYLKEWQHELSDTFILLKPSASQIREILDLLCDLKFQGSTWKDVSPAESAQEWIVKLFKLRNPNATRSDLRASNAVRSVNWPRGVRAKWERHGDQAGVTVQATITSPRDWVNFKANIPKINIEDDLWNL